MGLEGRSLQVMEIWENNGLDLGRFTARGQMADGDREPVSASSWASSIFQAGIRKPLGPPPFGAHGRVQTSASMAASHTVTGQNRGVVRCQHRHTVLAITSKTVTSAYMTVGVA